MKTSRKRDKSVVVLLRNGSGTARGTLRELSPAGCLVELAAPAPWAPGERLMIELQNVLLLEPLRALATCSGVTPDVPSMSLEFVQPELVERELPYALLAAYNRRRSLRVPIADVVAVRLGGARAASRPGQLALLIDVSVHGLGLRLPTEISRELGIGQVLELAFSLPDVEGGFRLNGRVKSLWPAGGYVGCGLQLDCQNPDFEAQRERLAQAVAQRRERLAAAH